MTYNRPGVYINERLLPAPITVTGTAQAAGAVVGYFASGPSTVTLVTSWYDFVKQFGGYNASYPATFGVGMFFQNGGTELYVRRILHNDATAASVAIVKGTGSGTVATATAKNLGSDGNNLRIQLSAGTISGYYNLTVYKENVAGTASDVTNDTVLESYTNLTFSNAADSSFVTTVLSLGSPYINISVSDLVNAPTLNVLPLTGGLDGTIPTASDYTNALTDFDAVDRPLVIFAPEIINQLGSSAGATVHSGLVSWAKANGKGYAVLDTDVNLSVSNAIAYASSITPLDSRGAVYYPNFYIVDPVGRSTSSLRKVGPAGAIAGLYIYTDTTTGPFKAPAGVRAEVRGALNLEKSFTATELDTLNSATTPVNALRNLPGAGIVSMGARTLLQDGTANRYVNMRRSLIYIEKSLNDITQFALFENNDENLWARIRVAIGTFLNQYRNQGGLRGESASQAYYVKCDAENNPDSTIQNGEVHIEIGVALQYPAEFVVINLSQKTAN
jgi:uncharacterized protein